MALIKCLECGKEISDSAETCPHCGCKTSHGQTVNNEKTSMLIRYAFSVGALIIGIIILCSGLSFINEYTSGYWGEYLWEEGYWTEDSDAVMAVVKVGIGIVMILCSVVDFIVLLGKASVSRSTPVRTIATTSQTSTDNLEDIPVEKRRYGVCEKCRLTGTVAVSIIPDTGTEHKLCLKCIQNYHARIK